MFTNTNKSTSHVNILLIPPSSNESTGQCNEACSRKHPSEKLQEKNVSAELLWCKTIARPRADVNHFILVTSSIYLYQFKILCTVLLL